jgi:hypothetical protein
MWPSRIRLHRGISKKWTNLTIFILKILCFRLCLKTHWSDSVANDRQNYQPLFMFPCGTSKVAREGWPLLTVETEVNGDSKSTNERGPSLVGSLGLSCRYKRFLFCLDCSSRPSTKYFFPQCTLFQCICPHRPVSWVDSRAGSPVSVSMGASYESTGLYSTSKSIYK